MGTEDFKALIGQQPFFSDLGDDVIETIAACAQRTECRHGHYLFFEGDSADQFFMVIDGQVGLQMGAGSLGFFTIETLTAGEVIGWSWLFPPYRWTLTARALCPTQYLTFDARALRVKCAEDPVLKYKLTKRTAMVTAQRLLAVRLSLMNNL